MKNARHIRLSSCASAEIPAQPLNSCAPRRLLSGALAVLVVLLFCPSILVNAVETNLTAYSKAYTIENILSDYQYFVSGDLTLGEHNVGAIACGGSATIGNFGDGAIAPSYIQNVLSIKNYNGGGYLSSYPEFSAYVGLPAYYKTAAGNTANMKLYDKGTSYIDFTSAFASLKSQSSSMASAVTNSHTATADDITGDIYNGFTLNLTFSGYENAIIPADIYNQINYIKLSGITSLEDLINKRYVVNVSGITNPSITFKYISYSESNASGTKGILYSDGQPFNNTNSIKNMPGTIQAGQMSMNGMKLVWNFPDADTVTTNYTAGHIVAPNADVTIESGTGNFEGGVIAQSVNNPDGEGHFYPYVAVGESSDPGVTTSPTIKLIKTDSGTTPLTGATFGLFSNADCTEAHRLASATSAMDTAVGSPTNGKAVVTFTSEPDGLTLSPSTTYYLKETIAPDDYIASSNVYDCIIDADGNVTYKLHGSTDTATATFPVCKNAAESDPTSPTIKLIKTDSGTTPDMLPL